MSVAGTTITALIGGGALAGVYLAWISARNGRAESARVTLAAIANDLAGLMHDHWEPELVVRQRHDLSNLSVSWAPAKSDRSSGGTDLSTGWAEIVGIAHEAGWPAPPANGTWAAQPSDLAGRGTKLTDTFAKVPTGRLVVLGEAGSGKTMLLARLLIDLVQRRDVDSLAPVPVPVLLSVGSWSPREQSLPRFIEEKLVRDDPTLGDHVLVGGKETSRIRALLDERMIVPILDGLDEIPAAFRTDAVDQINDVLTRPGPVVVSSRKAEYVQATDSGAELVRGSVAIELRPLKIDAIEDYLVDRGQQARWQAVFNDLDRPSALAEAFRTPLFVTLARVIYNPRRGKERPLKLDNPSELCDPENFGTAASIKDYLFNAFIRTVYGPVENNKDLNGGPLWRPDEAKSWLTFLANFLERQKRDKEQASSSRQPIFHPGVEIATDAAAAPVHVENPARLATEEPDPDLEQTQDLEWWALRNAAPRVLVPAIVGSVCGIAAGVAAALGTKVGVGIGIGLGAGMALALVIGRIAMRYPTRSAQLLSPGPGMAGALVGAVIGGLFAGLAHTAGFGYETSLFSGLPESLGIGIGGGASTNFRGGSVGGLVGGFVAGVLEGVGLGVLAGIINGLAVGFAAGMAVHYVGRREPASRRPTWVWRIGVPGGIVVGLVVGLVTWRQEGIGDGVGLAIILGALASWPFGLRDTPQELLVVPSPQNALARDTRAFWLTSVSSGLAAAAAGFFGGSLSSIYETGAKVTVSRILTEGLGIGLASGIIIGITFGFYHAASPAFHISNWWLAGHRKLPWRLMKFLEDAHQKSVLRQNGAVYQFRHEKLRVHLTLADQTSEQHGEEGSGRPRSRRAKPTETGPLVG